MNTDQVDQFRQSHPWWGLAVFAAAVIVTAAIGSIAVTGTVEQYKMLQQPSWAPPSWIFGPVWTVLYAMIAISGWLVWREVGIGAAIVVFAIQLILNAIWVPLFFGGNLFGLAFVDIVALWVLISIIIVMFWPISQLAAWLLVPYWVWVAFASALNFSIWRLN